MYFAMALTTVFVVLLLPQICSVALAHFLYDIDRYGGPVHIGGVEQLGRVKIANGQSSLCFGECYQNSECVIAIFSSEDYSCIMYKASNDGTCFTLEVDDIYRIKNNKRKTDCGSVELQYMPFYDPAV